MAKIDSSSSCVKNILSNVKEQRDLLCLPGPLAPHLHNGL